MVNINKKICIGCGVCIKDCPGKAIKLTDEKAEVFRACIQCGHCVAICPVDAVTIAEYEMEDIEEYDKETFHISPEHFLHAVKFRRSIRNYKDQPMEKEKIQRILEAGRYTATAKNDQDCQFVVVQDALEELKELVWKEMPAVIENLRETLPDYARAFEIYQLKHRRNPTDDAFFFNAPAFLVVASPNPLNGGLASANIETMAVAEGAGVLYNGYLMRIINNSPVLKEWLGILDSQIACCMLIGYPAVSYKRTAPRKKADIIWK